MKLLFLDTINWDYNIETVHQGPLGGSQSAFCYLAEALASRGHEVSFATNTSRPGNYRGVQCLTIPKSASKVAESLKPEVCVVLNACVSPELVRKFFGRDVFLVLWTQHAPDVPAIQDLANLAICDGYQYFAFVSAWQRAEYLTRFNLQPEKTIVHRNAIAPVFEGMFPANVAIDREKDTPPVLVYTSTPFRGLDVLLKVFPNIRKAVPGTRLKVFSSMKVYQVSADADAAAYGLLYRQCQETEGVEYCGSIAQHQLVNELRRATALAYPNTFAETSCIAVMEAMAAGCGIITSDLGALPETSAGYGHLVSLSRGISEYAQRFQDATTAFLQRKRNEPDLDHEQQLRQQVDYVNTNYRWEKRAEEWEAWLNDRRR